MSKWVKSPEWSEWRRHQNTLLYIKMGSSPLFNLIEPPEVRNWTESSNQINLIGSSVTHWRCGEPVKPVQASWETSRLTRDSTCKHLRASSHPIFIKSTDLISNCLWWFMTTFVIRPINKLMCIKTK